jgi:hypothetical protein
MWSAMTRRPSSLSDLGRAVHQGAAVVDGVVEERARHDEAVHVGDRHADRLVRTGPEAAAGHGAVQVEMLPVAPVRRRQDHRPAVDDDTEVADPAGVEHVFEVTPLV